MFTVPHTSGAPLLDTCDFSCTDHLAGGASAAVEAGESNPAVAVRHVLHRLCLIFTDRPISNLTCSRRINVNLRSVSNKLFGSCSSQPPVTLALLLCFDAVW